MKLCLFVLFIHVLVYMRILLGVGVFVWCETRYENVFSICILRDEHQPAINNHQVYTQIVHLIRLPGISSFIKRTIRSG